MSSKPKTTAKKEDGKPALMPKLRFPEFRDAEGWEERAIGDFGKVVTGNTPSTARRDYYDGGIPFTSPADISDLRFVNDTKTTLTSLGFEQTRQIKANSVLFVCIGSTIGKVAQNTQDCATNQQINSVIPNSDHSDGFVYFALSQNAERIAKLAGKQAVPIVNKTLFSSVKMLVPKLREQERIADCLSSLDELILGQSNQLDALKSHKKGLMQQLFPREGETQPRLRFPEFQDAPEWAEKNLETICKIQRGKFSHRPRNDPRFFGGKYPFIQTGDVVKSNGGSIEASQSLNELGLSVSKLFKPTIVLITIAANIGDTGLLDREACFTDSVVGLIPNNGVCPYFLELAVRGKKEYLNTIAPAAAQKNINNAILSVLPILVPEFEEQQCIASCLTSLDDLIAAQSTKLESLNTHKKGLMQQLFPSPKEVEA